MSYVPSATDAAEPTIGREVRSAAEEFRKIKEDKNSKDARLVTAEADIDTLQAIVAAIELGTDSTALAANLADPAVGKNSYLVAYKAEETDSVAGTVRAKLATMLHAVVDFGCDNTGATNTTTKMKAAWDAAIASGKELHIPSGDYLITSGVMVFDNGHIATRWPHITTGSDVVFKRANSVNASFITLSNGTAISGAGQYWVGGSIGNLTFEQNGQGTASGQHAFSLRGVSNMRFGVMTGWSLGGDTINIPVALAGVSGGFGGSNPDPYAVSSCKFEAVEANFSLGRALTNDNYVGFTGCTVGYLRAIGTGLGGLFGGGAGNTIDAMSCGQCFGWAIDDGTQVANTGGSPSRLNVKFAEIDGCEYGLRLNRLSISKLMGVRLVHRYKFGQNVSNLYYPITGIDICGGSLAGSVTQVDIQVVHRIETAMGAVLGLTVGANPVSTANGTNVITVTTTDPHTFTTGWTVAVLNSAAVGGVPAAEINGEHVITVTGANSFTFTSTTLASSTATGGGTTLTLSPLSALGQFVDGHSNASISGVNIDQFEINNAGFTSITADPSRLFTGVTANSSFLITRLDRPISDTRIRNGFQVRGATGRTILSQTLSQTSSKQIYATELVDRLSWHDAATGLATIGVTGTYDVFVSDTFTPNAASGIVEIAIAKFVGGAFSTLLGYKKRSFGTGTLGETTFELSRTVQLTKGDQLAYIIVQLTPAAGVSGTSLSSGSTAGMMFSAWMRNI